MSSFVYIQVGTAAVQICKSCGVRVIGTAGSPEGIELLKNMGVDAVYNHREPSYVEEVKKNETQIDMILEMLANVNLDHDLQLVRRLTGRIVVRFFAFCGCFISYEKRFCMKL